MDDLSLPLATQLPLFKSEDEEAAWWAEHSAADLPGEEMTGAFVEPNKPARVTIVITMTTFEATQLKRQAEQRGLELRPYVRLILNEKALEGLPGR